MMWQKISAWISSKGGWAHALAATWGFLVLAYASVAPFQQLVLSIYGAMPQWLHELAAALVGLVVFYLNTNKKADAEDTPPHHRVP
jgi:hypothetical protein